MDAFLNVYLFSFGATLGILLALAAGIAWVARRQPGDRQAEASGGGVERMRPAAKGKAILAVWGVALTVAVLVHLWLFKIPAFSGEVWKKHSFGRAGNVYVFEISLADRTYAVSEALYKAIAEGDRVEHPFAAPWTTVNGRPVIDRYTTALFGAVCGLIAAAALALTGFIATA